MLNGKSWLQCNWPVSISTPEWGSFPLCPSEPVRSPRIKHCWKTFPHPLLFTPPKLAQLPLSWCLHQSRLRASGSSRHVSSGEAWHCGWVWARSAKCSTKHPSFTAAVASLRAVGHSTENLSLLSPVPHVVVLRRVLWHLVLASEGLVVGVVTGTFLWSEWHVRHSTAKSLPFFSTEQVCLCLGPRSSRGLLEHILDTAEIRSSPTGHHE